MSSEHGRRGGHSNGEGPQSEEATPIHRAPLAGERARAVSQIHRSLRAWRSPDSESAQAPDGDQSKEQPTEGKAPSGGGDAEQKVGSDEAGQAELAEPEKSDAAVNISAKLKSLSRKVYRSGNGNDDPNKRKPDLNGGVMYREAIAKLEAAAPGSRVALWTNFCAQITAGTKGSWSASASAGKNGETIFVGTLVQNTLVIDKAGSVYRGDLMNKEQFPSMNAPNLAKLRKLF